MALIPLLAIEIDQVLETSQRKNNLIRMVPFTTRKSIFIKGGKGARSEGKPLYIDTFVGLQALQLRRIRSP